MSVYADDFKCRSMQVAIGYGIGRERIVFAKLIESTVLLLATAACMAVLILAAPLLLGLSPNSEQMASLALTVAADSLRALGYGALSSIAVFMTQNAVNGIIIYVLLSSKTIYIILSMLLGQDIIVNIVEDLTKFLYTNLLYTIRTDIV